MQHAPHLSTRWIPRVSTLCTSSAMCLGVLKIVRLAAEHIIWCTPSRFVPRCASGGASQTPILAVPALGMSGYTYLSLRRSAQAYFTLSIEGLYRYNRHSRVNTAYDRLAGTSWTFDINATPGRTCSEGHLPLLVQFVDLWTRRAEGSIAKIVWLTAIRFDVDIKYG